MAIDPFDIKSSNDYYDFGFRNNHSNRKFMKMLPKDLLSKLPMYDYHIDQMAEYLDWNIISQRYLSGWIIVKYAHKINWPIFLLNGHKKCILALFRVKEYILNNAHIFLHVRIRDRYYVPEFVDMFPEIINWKWYAKHIPNIPDYIILRYWSKFKSNAISRYQCISLKVAKNKSHQIDWNLASKNPLSEKTMEEMSNFLNWMIICKYQKLSIGFMDKHIAKCNLDVISRYQKLSESFILKYIKKLPMKIVSQYQNMSLIFIKQNIDSLHIELLYKNKNYNKRNSIKIFCHNNQYYIIDAPIVNNEKRVSFCEVSTATLE